MKTIKRDCPQNSTATNTYIFTPLSFFKKQVSNITETHNYFIITTIQYMYTTIQSILSFEMGLWVIGFFFFAIHS